MNDRRRGLGRGLGALIPTMPAEGTEGTSALTAPGTMALISLSDST